MLIKNILIDITGVLYDYGPNKAIKGSIEAIEKLSKSNINFAFLTNETTSSKKNLVKFLNSMGFNIPENKIISPSTVCNKYLKENDLKPFFLIRKDLYNDFDINEKLNENCVVIGDAEDEFNYENLNIAFNKLMNLENPVLISLGKNKYYRNYDKLCLDVGSFVTVLEFSSGIKAKVIGKPSKEYFELALNTFNMKAEETLMVGDDIEGDVNGAQNSGIKGVLVRTGKFRKEKDENNETIKPFLIVDNLYQIVEKVLNEEIF